MLAKLRNIGNGGGHEVFNSSVSMAVTVLMAFIKGS